MPKKISDNALLQEALEPAIQDRVSFADAYGNAGPEAEEALELARTIKLLKRVPLSKMTEAQLQTAALAFIYAEQWESSLADALPKGAERDAAREGAERFRVVRTRIYGKNKLEVFLETAEAIEVMPVNRFLQKTATTMSER